MDKILKVINKLLLTVNWIFFGGVGIVLFITSIKVDETPNNNFSIYSNEWWYSLVTIFSGNPTSDIILWIGIGSIVIGIIVHMVINWIFE